MEDYRKISPDNTSGEIDVNHMRESGNTQKNEMATPAGPRAAEPKNPPAEPGDRPSPSPEVNPPDRETPRTPEINPPDKEIPRTPEINPPDRETPRTPEINLPGTGNPRTDIGLPPRGEALSDPPPPTEYRWTYGDELRRVEQKRRNSGVLTYAIIMTIAFALCFTTMLGILLYESGALIPRPTRTIFVRELDNDSGVLTIPEIAAKVRPSVVGITVSYENLLGVGSGVGTGIIMSADGYIATNYHVVEKSLSIVVTVGDGREYNAEVVGYDALSDLAVIKIDADRLTPAEFGDSSELIVGELVVAIGTPAGLEYAETTTNGIISGIDRNVKIYDQTGVMSKKMTLIQTNATVNPGNSGGPLINEYGQVIGIITLKLGDGFDGIGFAIPTNGALPILNEIIETGSSTGSQDVAQRRAVIGISAISVSAGENRFIDGTVILADIAGVYVSEVNQRYGAAGKLEPGDIITEVDGKKVLSTGEVMNIINEKFAGDSVMVTFYRNGEYNTVIIELWAEE